MAPTLKVNFAGVSMPNPFMLSSAPPTTNVEMVARCFEAGWGGAVLKTLAYTLSQAQNVNPRITAVKSADGEIVGFTNFELGSPKHIEKWAKDTRWLKERFPEHGVWVSLLHTEGLVEEQWREVTRMFDEAGADGFELNFSCSHGMAESGGGATVGGSEEAIKMVTTWVREETKKPVMTKLPAIVQDIPGKARAAEAAGADAIATINTLNSLPGIDIHTFVPYPSVDGRSAFQGLSGAAIKPIALRTVAQIAKAVNIPVSGIGGIYNWRDAVEFILAGASSLQVCSAVMHHGYRIINDMTPACSTTWRRWALKPSTTSAARPCPISSATTTSRAPTSCIHSRTPKSAWAAGGAWPCAPTARTAPSTWTKTARPWWTKKNVTAAACARRCAR